jgi:hypothetical protein
MHVLHTSLDGATHLLHIYLATFTRDAVTSKDCFPQQRIDINLDMLTTGKWFSTLGFMCGYWQVAMHTTNKQRRAFSNTQQPWLFTCYLQPLQRHGNVLMAGAAQCEA